MNIIDCTLSEGVDSYLAECDLNKVKGTFLVLTPAPITLPNSVQSDLSKIDFDIITANIDQTKLAIGLYSDSEKSKFNNAIRTSSGFIYVSSSLIQRLASLNKIEFIIEPNGKRFLQLK